MASASEPRNTLTPSTTVPKVPNHCAHHQELAKNSKVNLKKNSQSAQIALKNKTIHAQEPQVITHKKTKSRTISTKDAILPLNASFIYQVDVAHTAR